MKLDESEARRLRKSSMGMQPNLDAVAESRIGAQAPTALTTIGEADFLLARN